MWRRRRRFCTPSQLGPRPELQLHEPPPPLFANTTPRLIARLLRLRGLTCLAGTPLRPENCMNVDGDGGGRVERAGLFFVFCSNAAGLGFALPMVPALLRRCPGLPERH